MLIYSIAITLLALFLGSQWYSESKESGRKEKESYEKIIVWYDKYKHQRRMRYQAEEALRAQVESQQDFIKTLPITALNGRKRKQASTTPSVQVVEQVSKGKSRKSEQSGLKKAEPTQLSSKPSKVSKSSSRKAIT